MNGMRDRRVRVWFKHDVLEHTSIYMLHNCSEGVREAIQDRIKLLASSKGCPGDLMLIDYIIVNEVAGSWIEKILDVYKKLLHYVRRSALCLNKLPRAADTSINVGARPAVAISRRLSGLSSSRAARSSPNHPCSSGGNTWGPRAN